MWHRWLFLAGILSLAAGGCAGDEGGIPGGLGGEGGEGGAAGSGGDTVGDGGQGAAGGDTGQGGQGGSGGGTVDECPVGVICVDSLPYTDSNTTADGAAQLDGYSCAPAINESGPEKVYRVDVADDGLLVASLDGLGSGVDVDVHILQQLDVGTCIDRGHWDAAALLTAGRYWIVVDSWVDDSLTAYPGSYELTLVLNNAADHVAHGLDPTVFGTGLFIFQRGWLAGDTDQLEYGIIDYTMPSVEPRFFVVDLRQGELMHSVLVAHGEGSQDPADLTLTGSMSNVSGSHASSVGLVLTAETYSGSNGYSLRLDGLEPGFNDNDRSRAIVVHGADYATQSFVDAHGYLGRSWGCPAIDPAIHDLLIDDLKEGRLLLKYFDDAGWLSNSTYLSP